MVSGEPAVDSAILPKACTTVQLREFSPYSVACESESLPLFARSSWPKLLTRMHFSRAAKGSETEHQSRNGTCRLVRIIKTLIHAAQLVQNQ